MKKFITKAPFSFTPEIEYVEKRFSKWTKSEFTEAWYRAFSAQGQQEARKRERHCVVVHTCKESEALVLAAVWCRLVFAMPSCTHFDGLSLSLHYGQCGHSAINSTRIRTELVVEAWRWGILPDVHGALFADDDEPRQLESP